MFFAHILYAIAPVVDQLEIPFVDVISGADDITQRKPCKWLVRLSWTSSMVAHPFGEYCYKTLHFKKIATVVSDYAYGYEIVGGFQKTFEDAGGQIIQKIWLPLGFQDYTPFLKQISPDADAVFICQPGKSAEYVPKQYKELGFKKPLIGATASFEEYILNAVGTYLKGGISTNPYSAAINTPANKQFVEAFRMKYGEDPGFFSECGYDSGHWIVKAIESLHGDVSDRHKVMAALRKVQLTDSPRGPMKLDGYGNVVDNIYIRRVDEVNGKFQNTVIYTYPMVSQFWKYKPADYLAHPAYTKDYPPCTHCIQPPQ
jgi:branched-chain amino acid transport system substrate-binding protein